jgi:serine/arginine repetitive matrix protein 2
LRSLVSFSQLQRQIIDLATTHFVHLPVRPPAEDLAQVPSNLPSFLGDTIAARYVQAIPNSLDLHLTLS